MVAALPLESDAFAFLSLTKLKSTPQWGLLAGLATSSPTYEAISSHCGVTLADLPDQAAAAMAYHRTDSTIRLSGRKFPADKIMACLPKLATEKGLTAKPEGPHSLLFPTPKGAACCDLRVTRTGPHELIVTVGEAVKAQAAGKKRTPLGSNAKVFGLVDRVGGTDMWFLSLGLPPELKNKLPSTNAVTQIRALALGVSLTDKGLALKLVVDMRSSKAAKDLASVLNRYLPGLDRYAVNLAPLKPIFSKLKIGAESNFLTVAIDLTWAELGKLQMLSSFVPKTIGSVSK